MTCPDCGCPAEHVIYLGFPMWLCHCSTVFGFWSWTAVYLPIFTEDEHGDPAWKFWAFDGAYLPALWLWLRGGDES